MIVLQTELKKNKLNSKLSYDWFSIPFSMMSLFITLMKLSHSNFRHYIKINLAGIVDTLTRGFQIPNIHVCKSPEWFIRLITNLIYFSEDIFLPNLFTQKQNNLTANFSMIQISMQSIRLFFHLLQSLSQRY